eukprot:1159101-Pelagomonas_calceolata.AAC.3
MALVVCVANRKEKVYASQKAACIKEWFLASKAAAAAAAAGSGNCYEVKCSNMGFRDGNGKYLDRTSACYDENKS